MIATASNAVLQALGNDLGNVESPSLRLEKFVNLREHKQEEARKRAEVDAVVAAAETHGRAAPPSRFVECSGVQSDPMKLQARLIINQAGGILENAGICLHRHFGFPYIPGSAVKGIARHAAWSRWHGMDDPEEKRDIALRTALVFGFPTESKRARAEQPESLDVYLIESFPALFSKDGQWNHLAGAISFLPAWPAGKARLVTDIVNCHHRDYYRDPESNRPLDNENPNPQFFPAVAEGTVFDVAITPTRRAQFLFSTLASIVPASCRPRLSLEDLLTFARECLHQGLEIHGAGAKTAAGYGWFEYDRKRANQDRQEREERERQRQREAQLAAMSPEDRRVEKLGALGREAFIRDHINQLRERDEAEQRVIIRALIEKHHGIWDKDRKAKPRKKGGKRATAVRDIAASLGIDLP